MSIENLKLIAGFNLVLEHLDSADGDLEDALLFDFQEGEEDIHNAQKGIERAKEIICALLDDATKQEET